jgi:alpha-tubulin suppressor-like RCC1 family protein
MLLVLVLIAASAGSIDAGALGRHRSTASAPNAVTAVTGAALVPGAPFIVSVAGDGLTIDATWVPANVTDDVLSYTLSPTAVPVAGVKLPHGCATPTPTVIAGSNTAGTIDGVCANVAYTVTMTATNATGTGPASAPSNPVVPLPATAPSAPVITNVTGRDRALIVDWSAPTDDGGRPVLGYLLTATDGAHPKSLTVGPTTFTATLSGLVNRRAYAVVLQTFNTRGRSPAATSSGVPVGVHVPNVPQDLSVVPGAAAGTVGVSWAAPADDGGAPITGYHLTYNRVLASTNPTTGDTIYTPNPAVPSITMTVTGTSTTITGLDSKDVFYTFTVAATNTRGTGAATSPSQPTVANTVTTSNTVVLDTTTLAGLASDTDMVLKWQYATDAAVPTVISNLTVGNVLVAGVSPQTPNGLLRTVVSVAHPSVGTYEIGTVDAALSEAFADLSASTSVNPLAPTASPLVTSPTAGTFVPTVPGVRVKPSPSASAGFSTSITLGLNVSSQSTNDQGSVAGSVSGEVELTPSVTFDASIHTDWIGIPDRASLAFTALLGVSASATLSASGTLRHQWKIGEIDSAPIDIQVGPVPVVILPKIPIYLTLSATGTVGVTTSASMTFGAKASWTSDNPTQLSIQNLSHAPTATNEPTPTVLYQAEASLGLEAKPDVLVYGITGPEIDVSVSLDATFNPSAAAPKPWFTLKLDLDAQATWTVDLLVIHAQVSADLGSTVWTIYTRSGTPPARLTPLTLSPSAASANPGSTIQFTATGTTKQVLWSLRGHAGDTVTNDGLVTLKAPAGRTLTVIATDSQGRTAGATINVGLVGPPTDLTATSDPDGTGATITWTPPTLPSGETLASYTITTDAPTQTTTTTGTATSVHITGLTPNISYLISAVAQDAAGVQSPTATTTLDTTITTPSAGNSSESISTDGHSTCAIVKGAAECWGEGGDGELGNGANADSPVPVQVAGLTSDVTAISVGFNGACAIVNGAAECWGSGALGNGAYTHSPVPVQVAGLTAGVTAISVGWSATCAIVNGAAECWGQDAYGELGNGATRTSLVPVQVAGLTSGVTAISTGYDSACAIVNGAAECWGRNAQGELGDGGLTASLVPVQVIGLASGVTAIGTGVDVACAIVNGAAECWGADGGNLGNGTYLTMPVHVGLPSGVTAISVAQYDACAIVNGAADCWGNNAVGELGNGTNNDSLVPVQVAGLTSGVTALSTGENDACAIANGAAECWGNNDYGQLGNGTNTGSNTPVPVAGLS